MTTDKEQTTRMTEILGQENWFAIQAKPQREDLAAASVGRFDLEVFLPKLKQEQSVCGIRRMTVKPLFQGYFFARFCPLISLESVAYARGVLRVVGTRQFPLPVASEIIAGIRARVQPDGLVWLDRRSFRPGDQVTIEQGPLAGLIGRIEREWDDHRRVAILLDTLQQMRVLVETRCLAPAAA
jgi:transcriptional antiterminator RfaH